MILITLLVMVLLEYYFKISQTLRNTQCLSRYCAWAEQRLTSYFAHPLDFAVILGVLSPVVLLVGLLQSALNTPLWGLLDLTFGIFILLLTIDASDFIRVFMQSNSDESIYKNLVSDNPGHLTFAQLLRAQKERILAPIFWYVILGPMGAILYRLSIEMKQVVQNEVRKAYLSQWVSWLEWLPVRFTVLSFAVVDNFLPCFGYGLNSFLLGASHNDDVLIDGATQASSIKAQASVADKPETVGLIAHSIILWLVIVAILTVTAWVN